MIKYSVIVPTYNHCDDLLKPCLESIFKHTDMSEVELIVSANGCTDNSRWYLESLKNQFGRLGFGEHFKVVWSDAPLGYALANNVALEHATADKIVLLNNDCVLLDQPKNQWLQMLDGPFADPQCGISCVIKDRSEPANREFAVFFCVMVHKKVFAKIGSLNTEYGVGGGEDVEFCVEAEAAGFKVLQCTPKTWGDNLFTGQFPIYHKGEGTVHDPACVPNWSEIFNENALKLADKYNPGWSQQKADAQKALQVQSAMRWICEQGEEAVELFNEVVVENIYKASEANIKGRAVIDIGANIGTFSIMAAHLGAAQVVAVEPVAATHERLLKNVQKAGAEGVVSVKKAVVLDEAGREVQISVNPKSGHNSVYGAAQAVEPVRSVTLRDLMENVSGNDIFLKIDCEGSEYDILGTAAREDMDRVSTVAIEIHGNLHPVHRGFDFVHEKLASFGLTMREKKQIWSWDLDAQGRAVNYRELPVVHEVWSR